MSLNFRVLGMAALALGAIALSSTTKAADPDRVVLPTSVAPTAYRITITPDTKALTFSGDVQIDISVRAATATIVLNSADLVIDHAGLTGAKAPLTVAYDSAAQTVTLAAGRVLKPGAYTLNLAYHGQIFRQASGLFALDYATPSGQARALYTQFENSDARRFVPSWDEPGRKATFQLTAIVPEGQMALSNNRLTARRAELLALETRVASVRKLLDRRSLEQRRRSDRQEQRISDDAAQHATRNPGPLSAAWSASTEAQPLTHH